MIFKPTYGNTNASKWEASKMGPDHEKLYSDGTKWKMMLVLHIEDDA